MNAPLLRDADFQAAWYYSMVLFAGMVLIGWGSLLTLQHLREMWARGDRGLALGVGGAAAVALLMFLAILATVAVAMLPLAATAGAR